MARGKKKETLTPEDRLQAALVPESEQPYPVPGNWCWGRLGSLLSEIKNIWVVFLMWLQGELQAKSILNIMVDCSHFLSQQI